MSRVHWFDEYLYPHVGTYRRYRLPNDMSAHVSVGLSSLEDINRAEHQEPTTDEERAELWLATEALWQAVRTALDLTDDDLWAVMDELDRLDGVVDERHVQPRRACAACGAAVPAERTSCQFCGADVPDPSLFPG